MMTEFCWLIGGSLMSIPMAKEIKRRGYKLLLTDKNKYCAGTEYADYFAPISVYDEVANLDFAKHLKHKIIAMLCIGCDAGPTVSLVSDYLELPSVGYEVAKRAKDKLAVRKTLDLDHPHFDFGFTTDHGLIADSSLRKRDYPLIVKPIAESGSKGFRVISSDIELQEALEEINGEVIIEELLIGQDVIPEWRDQYGFDTSEIALDFFVQNGKVYYANGALRMFWEDMPGIEAGHVNPYVPTPEIVEKTQYAAEKLGVTWGPFKCDFKQDKRYGWVIMETATRLSGGFDHMYTAKLATGKDITGAMLDVALGKPFTPKMVEAKYHSFVCAYAPRFKPGKIEGFPGQAITPVLFDDGWNIYQESQEIKPLTSNHHRPLFIIRRGQTMDDALKSAMEYAERIEPNYV